jgi:hypothetical protein
MSVIVFLLTIDTPNCGVPEREGERLVGLYQNKEQGID